MTPPRKKLPVWIHPGEWIVASLLALGALFLHVTFFTRVGALWRDEVNSFDFASMPLGQAHALLRYDSFPLLTTVLLRGWIKIDTGPKARGDGIQIASRVLSVATGRATLVFNVTPGSTQVFVESGSVTAVALEPPLSPVTVSDGQFAQRAANLPITVARALPAQFLSAMPRAFRDNLPPLATRFAGQDAPPGRLREASYADAADLLTLPRRWRAGLVRRFEGRTQDAAFRAALDANLLQHPEWDRVLHPEKYLPPPEPHADDETKKRLSATEGNSQ